MSQKLSLREFLDYFKKVERIVEKMEQHCSSSESRINEIL